MEICAIKGEGGIRRLMAYAILNFHFDYLNLSHTQNPNQVYDMLPDHS